MSGKSTKTDRGLYEHGVLSNVMVLALMLLFAALSIALIALGARAYDAVRAAAEKSAQQRATVSYLLSRIRAFDGTDQIVIGDATLNGERVTVLTLEEDIDGEIYHTRIYCADGELREQTVPSDIPLESAEDGDRIADLDAFDVQQEGQLLTLRFINGDREQMIHAALHSVGGEAP